jgi:hypothetical protein
LAMESPIAGPRGGEMAETGGKTAKSEKLEEARSHVKAAREAVRKGWEQIIPKEFIEHRRAARKEMLLAMRSLIDAAIERVEKKASPSK